MQRRDFIKGIVGSATAWPFAAPAQQSALPMIGFLHAGRRDDLPTVVSGLRQGLKVAGLVEGQNVTIEFRWADNNMAQLPILAADLARRQVAVIVSGGGTVSALAAKAATSTIPIVLAFGGDPIKLGLAASLNPPGGNVTGITFFTNELVSKRVELLCELLPQAKIIAYLSSGPKLSTATTEQMANDFLTAARRLGRQSLVLQADSEGDFESAFLRLVDQRGDALVISSNALFDSDGLRLWRFGMPYRLSIRGASSQRLVA